MSDFCGLKSSQLRSKGHAPDPIRSDRLPCRSRQLVVSVLFECVRESYARSPMDPMCLHRGCHSIEGLREGSHSSICVLEARLGRRWFPVQKQRYITETGGRTTRGRKPDRQPRMGLRLSFLIRHVSAFRFHRFSRI